MSLSLFLINLKLSRLALVALPLVLGAYGALIVYLYPFIDDAGFFVENLRQLPLEARSALGLTDGLIDGAFPNGRFSFYGALTTNYLVWWPVFLGVYAAIYGSGAIANEMDRRILSTLLLQPLRRYKFVVSKLTAFLCISTIAAIVSWAGVMAAVVIVGIDTSIANITIAHVIGLMLVLAIFSYSALASSLFPQAKSALALAVLITFVFYMLNIMAPSYGSASWLANGSIFHFYQPFELLEDAQVNWAGVGVYGGIILLGNSASVMVFTRRDVRT